MAFVDHDDAAALSEHRWHLLRTPSGTYARTSLKCADGKHRTMLMHRMLMKPADGVLVDHRDGIGLHNWRSNLRFANHQQNARNARAKGESGFVGVKRLGSAWLASISPERGSVSLGTYPTAEIAAAVYNQAARRLYGEFARLNRVPDAPDAIAQVVESKHAQILRLTRDIEILRSLQCLSL